MPGNGNWDGNRRELNRMYAFGQCLRGKCPPFDLRDKELSVVSKVKFRKISLIYKFVFFDLIKFRF